MPFGGWFDEYYEQIFYPAIENCNLEPKRADDLYRPSNIVQDIWSLTKKSKFVLADLTGKNPNVFYELGLAHSLAKPAILVTQNLEDVPFDLRNLRVIVYDRNSPNWGDILKENIQLAITETIDSPKETIPTAFLQVSREDVKQARISKHDRDILEMRNELDSLKSQVFRASLISERRESPEISQKEALSIMEDYLRRGLPEVAILRRLSERYKVPVSWAKARLVEKAKKEGRSRKVRR
jgi:hypothetical protein